MSQPQSLQPGIWHIGVHGSPSAGKTCYLAALYGFRSDGDGAAVSFVDNPTIDYLAERWDQYLARGENPPATALGIPHELRCELKGNGRVWEVALRDYAGELVHRKGSGASTELRTETRDWLRSCNAILCFLDITDPDAKLRERLNELDVLLAGLHELSADGNMIARPMALVLTKWDSVDGVRLWETDRQKEQRRAMELLQGHPVFEQFIRSLETATERLAVFPVSAFGEHRNGNLPPEGGPRRPFNLHYPLLWSVEKAEQMIVDRTERHVDGLVRRFVPKLLPARDVVSTTLERYRINKGPGFDRLSRLRRSLTRRIWARRAKWTVALIAVSLVATLAALIWSDHRSYSSLARAFDDSEIGFDELGGRVQRYQSGWNPVRGWLARDVAVQKRWEARQYLEADKEFAALQQIRAERATVEDAENRLAECVRFLKRWPGSRHGEAVETWRLSDEAAAREHLAALARKQEDDHLTRIEEFRNTQPGDEFAEARLKDANEFLARWPNGQHRTRVQSWVRDDNLALGRLEDEKQFHALEAQLQTLESRDKLDEAIRACDEYLAAPQLQP